MNYNRVILSGNLTRDPELRYSQGGTAYAKFGLAINETRVSNGEKTENTVFVDLTAFGKTAEAINTYLKKGDPIFVEGKLDFSTWSDKTTGATRSKLAVIVNTFQFLGSKRDKETIDASGIRRDPTTDKVPF